MESSDLKSVSGVSRNLSTVSRILDEREANAVFLLDSTGMIVAVSKETKSLAGYSPQELHSRDVSILFGKQFRVERVQRYMAESDESFPIAIETWLKSKDDDLIPVTVRASRMANVAGSFSYILIVSRSNESGIAGLLECGANVCLAREEYQDNLMLVAHDTKGPMATIKGYLRLLEKQDLQGTNSDHALELISGALRALERLEDIVEMIAEMGMDEERGARRYVFLSDLANKAAHGLAHDLTAAKTILSIENLGTAYANPLEITEVFQNLIENAIRYGHQPNQPSKIRVALVPGTNSDEVQVMVSDRGPGLPEEDRPRIFDLFDRSGDHYEGARGLGLAICKKFVVNNGGKIWLESDEGMGTRFSFSLPRRKLFQERDERA
ncbi:MAG: PAS domain-containing sensor histidine kinase [Actinomycetota bacterium]|jgi:PAS domain S-box-containing protein|nr:PAS domain-containing sensor histidine kinase [Actinomycetota bacterium]